MAVNVPEEYLRRDFLRARAWWGELIDAAERRHGIPALLAYAVYSRETNLGRHWDTAPPASPPPRPTDDGLTYFVRHAGDGGHGRGIGQVDDRSHAIPADWATNIAWQIDASARILGACLVAEKGDVVRAANRYNSGQGETSGTTGRDYGPDVAERWTWLAANAGAVPVDDDPPAELDPLGVNRGAHSVDIPRELAPLRYDLGLPSTPLERAAPVATVEAALAFLEGQLGLGEYPPGSNANWITDWYYGWQAAWCAMTVSRALIEAGFGTAEAIDIAPVPTTSAKGWAYCPYIESDFRSVGRWYGADDTTPEPGDLVLYDWDGDGWADHVGMLQSVDDDGSLWVYEGNTDEGVLRLKHRSLTYVRGFARPPYSAVAAPPDTIPEPQEEDDDVAKIIGVTNNRGLFLVGSTPLATVKGKGRIPAVYMGTPDEVIALAASGAAERDESKPDLPEAVFDRRYIVVG